MSHQSGTTNETQPPFFLLCSCPLICPFTPALSLCLSSSLHGLCPRTHSFTPQWDTAVCTYTFSMEMNAHTRSPTHSDTHISIALGCHDWWLIIFSQGVNTCTGTKLCINIHIKNSRGRFAFNLNRTALKKKKKKKEVEQQQRMKNCTTLREERVLFHSE